MKNLILTMVFALTSVFTLADNSGDKPVEDLPSVFKVFKDHFKKINFDFEEDFNVIVVFSVDIDGNVKVENFNTDKEKQINYIKKAIEKEKIDVSAIIPGKKYAFRLVYKVDLIN